MIIHNSFGFMILRGCGHANDKVQKIIIKQLFLRTLTAPLPSAWCKFLNPTLGKCKILYRMLPLHKIIKFLKTEKSGKKCGFWLCKH